MARLLTHIVNRANIWMIESRGGARLALKTFSRSQCAKRLRQNLDRDLAMEPGVPSLIDFAHTALTDGRQDLVGAEPLTGWRRLRVRAQTLIATVLRSVSCPFLMGKLVRTGDHPDITDEPLVRIEREHGERPRSVPHHDPRLSIDRCLAPNYIWGY